MDPKVLLKYKIGDGNRMRSWKTEYFFWCTVEDFKIYTMYQQVLPKQSGNFFLFQITLKKDKNNETIHMQNTHTHIHTKAKCWKRWFCVVSLFQYSNKALFWFSCLILFWIFKDHTFYSIHSSIYSKYFKILKKFIRIIKQLQNTEFLYTSINGIK